MINKLRRILSLIDLTNNKIAWIASFLLLLLACLVPYEVIVRYVFRSPTSWSLEITQFIFCALVALGGAWVLNIGGHVNVDIIYNRFGVRGKAIVSLVTSLVLFTLLSILFWKSLGVALQSLAWRETSGSGWDPPLYHIKFLIPLGALMLLTQSIARFIRFIIQAITGVEEVKEGGIIQDEAAK